MNGADSQVRTYNAAIPGIVQSKVNAGRRVHFVDMYPALAAADLADGVHPNAGGYAKMATVWFNALRSVPRSITDGTTPTPPTSTPPTSAPPTSVPPTGGCTATYRLVNSWSGGFQSEVTVTNNGASTFNGWTANMTLAGGQTITSLWNGVNIGTSGAVTVRNAAYNGTIAGNGSTTFGYTASGNGSTAPAGLRCTSP